ncbi:MAG: anthranilate phosphoribosyltransferase [Bdellovibrionales bacterium]|nr:anthranilate phosphoribosyltransferase [Bdellovibrionales bacterium]
MRETLNELCQYHTIDRIRAKELLLGIAQGEYDPVLVASFLTVFRMRNVTVPELLGFRDAMLELAIVPDLGSQRTVDLCGTGGDGKDTFNISTLAAFVTAGAGVHVTKHGNVSVSSQCGSSDVLQELGAKFTNDESVLRKQLEQGKFCYLHAPLFHPAMKNVAPIRKALGVRTFFNLLGPLVNPAKPHAQLIGVFSLEIARLFHYLLSAGTQDYFVIHSLDGYDEVSLTSDWRIFGRKVDTVVSCEDAQLDRFAPELLFGGPKERAAELFRTILEGKGSEAQNAVVCANAGYGIMLGLQLENYSEALELARRSLFSGAARKSFDCFIELGNEG